MAPVYAVLGQTEYEKFLPPVGDREYLFNCDLYECLCVFLFGTDVQFYILIFRMFIVRSDQGGSRNLFSTKVKLICK